MLGLTAGGPGAIERDTAPAAAAGRSPLGRRCALAAQQAEQTHNTLALRAPQTSAQGRCYELSLLGAARPALGVQRRVWLPPTAQLGALQRGDQHASVHRQNVRWRAAAGRPSPPPPLPPTTTRSGTSPLAADFIFPCTPTCAEPWQDDMLRYERQHSTAVAAPQGAPPIVLLPGFGNCTEDYTAPFGDEEASIAAALQVSCCGGRLAQNCAGGGGLAGVTSAHLAHPPLAQPQRRGFSVYVLPLTRKDWFKVARALLTPAFYTASSTTHPGYSW